MNPWPSMDSPSFTDLFMVDYHELEVKDITKLLRNVPWWEVSSRQARESIEGLYHFSDEAFLYYLPAFFKFAYLDDDIRDYLIGSLRSRQFLLASVSGNELLECIRSLRILRARYSDGSVWHEEVMDLLAIEQSLEL